METIQKCQNCYTKLCDKRVKPRIRFTSSIWPTDPWMWVYIIPVDLLFNLGFDKIRDLERHIFLIYFELLIQRFEQCEEAACIHLFASQFIRWVGNDCQFVIEIYICLLTAGSQGSPGVEEWPPSNPSWKGWVCLFYRPEILHWWHVTWCYFEGNSWSYCHSDE